MSQFDNMQADGLDGRSRGHEVRVMTRTPMLIMLVAAAALAGCNKENHTIVAGGPVEDNANLAANANVPLPPSIQASKTYRCGDNTIVYVDWMSDGSAHVKTKTSDVPTNIAAGSADLKGDAKAATVTYKGQSCTA
jgi:hypothetical protein